MSQRVRMSLVLGGLILFFQADFLRAQNFVPQGGEQGKRRDQLLEALRRKPYPPKGEWSLLGQALAFYWAGDAPKGDATMLKLQLGQDEDDGEEAETSFHWRGFLIARILFLFGSGGVFRPGTMSLEAEKHARGVLWNWLEPRARRALADPANDWLVWKSENHHLQAWATLWGSLTLFASEAEFKDRVFADGSTVSELKIAFDDYFKRWIRQRATRGLFVECGSPTYAKYSVAVFYNLADFSDDAELRRLARNFLDLCWSQWALEQIDGIRGGSRHRSYSGSPSISGGALRGLAWVHFGIGEEVALHPASWCPATSSYAPADLVQDVAQRRGELGEYEIVSRQPGLSQATEKPVNFVEDPKYPFFQASGLMVLDPQCGSLLRKTYAAPGFVLGTSMVPALPSAAWSAISSQNRWDGVIFSGAQRLFIQPERPLPKGSIYNSEWSVQDKGVVLIQRLLTAKGAANQRVWLSGGLRLEESGGWLFVEASEAYAAIKVVDGEWELEDDSPEYWRDRSAFKPGLGKWLAPRNAFSPLILEVSSKSSYTSFAEFCSEITGNMITRSADQLDYQSTRYGTRLTLATNFSAPPLINGEPVPYDAPQCFSGGPLQADFGGDQVVLRAFGREMVFPFGKAKQ